MTGGLFVAGHDCWGGQWWWWSYYQGGVHKDAAEEEESEQILRMKNFQFSFIWFPPLSDWYLVVFKLSMLLV